ncbi:DNA gyrase subunit A [Metallumcola ferriviriculae]|uniref:DNA gyrase subunit A n=1 Tax=Metallumcola ferriviriculae TaxID=3039180 RepID=A0AAU0UIW2_9FIRM|nr:DNA gyrase subunit A [Desulfitibacteraceae bacterium MK1]
MNEYTHGKIVPINIEEEMKNSYLDYAMSVIVGRALPDVRDGLKPVHRRILYAMYDSGITPDKPHKKSARVVGDVMARYHPHGDSAIYDTMVRMAQDFSTRYQLIDGHGNFGSVDGDAAAAMRYTEARMSKIAMELLKDIDKDTVNFAPNYDETMEEPVVLPSKYPNLLVNGSSGIAVGMSTNIPPHNLREVIDSLVMMIENPDITAQELMMVVKGPDFPTGGIIMGRKGIKSAYTTGRGIIKIRAKTLIEKMANGKMRIMVSELPYQVNKARLVEKIAGLVRDKKIEGITDLRDESDRTGMRVIIELRKDINPNIMLNQLYKHTQLQETFGIIMLALVDGQPKVLNLREVLFHYLEHQKEIIIRRTKYLLKKAEARAHIVEGLKIALNKLDEVINTIKTSDNPDIAKKALMSKFDFSEKQAQAILDMRLQRLTGLEREKIEEEYKELIKKIAYYTEILNNPRLVMSLIKEELEQIKQKYADKRRTQFDAEEDSLDVEDLIAEEDIVITMTHRGYIKRLPVTTYRSQRRGGRGISGITTRDEDFVERLFITTTHHHLLFFTNQGKVYRLKGHEIPEASRQAKGTALINLLYLNKDEWVSAVIPVKDFQANHYLLMATKHGLVKKTLLEEYDSIRRDGLIALNLVDDDELIGVRMTTGKEDILLGTKEGMSIRFNEEEVRSTGRATRGVKGINLSGDDQVVGMEIVKEDADVMVITEKGFGKRTDIKEYRVQSRGGKGLLAYRRSERNGRLATIKLVTVGEELMMINTDGVVIRIAVEGVSKLSRTTQGVTLMRLDEGDKIVSVAKVVIKETKDD